MPSLYRPRKGGSIEVVSEKAAAELVSDLTIRPDSTEYVEPEEKFINDYIQQNAKRIQVKVLCLVQGFFSCNRLFRVQHRVREARQHHCQVMEIPLNNGKNQKLINIVYHVMQVHNDYLKLMSGKSSRKD